MTGAEMIAAERERQVQEEGWTAEHDDQNRFGQLEMAADCYLSANDHMRKGVLCEVVLQRLRPTNWPWLPKWWKPHPDPVRNLVKAGALIAAEIDRIQRARKR